MINSVLNRNLASLKKKDPDLFEKIIPLKGSKFYAATKSKSGHPSLVYINQDGKKKQIDSNYDPVGEAIRNLERFKIRESINFIVLGLGLGCQVSEIIKKKSKHAKIYIFEKDPELFALAIRESDFTLIFEHPGVRLFVDTDLRDINNFLEPERTNFTLNKYCLISQKALVDRNFEYYGVLYEEIEKYFKESTINLNTQSVHSKVYYKNIFSNQKCLRSSPGIKNLKGCLSDTPAIICSAGPSLDKNIQLLKSSRKGFFLIAVATALKPLLHNGIQPDVVISIDPDELTIRSFDLFRDSGDTWLVYNAAVPNAIPQIFPTRKMAFDLDVHLAKWFNKYSAAKGSLGKTSSVAHSALNFAEFLSCSPVILIGQDLSFQNQRLHCTQSFYFEDSINLVSRFKPLYYLNRLKYLKFSPNLTERIDIFGCQVGSTVAMDSYRQIFSSSHDTSKTVINATEGGVPINEMNNLSLREVLYYYCRNTIKKKLESFITPLSLDIVALGDLHESTCSLLRYLENISEKMNSIKLKQIETPSEDHKKYFVDNMKILYKSILEDKEIALLLQDYDFAGFSDWYRSNSQILNKTELFKDCSQLNEEYERDLIFLEVLEDSVKYLRCGFERSLSPEN
jgi:hypothetical protein